MDKQTLGLIAWAARMIREQDEYCRSNVPNWGTFSQEEMRNLKALEALAGGANEPDSTDWRRAWDEERDSHLKLIQEVMRLKEHAESILGGERS